MIFKFKNCFNNKYKILYIIINLLSFICNIILLLFNKKCATILNPYISFQIKNSDFFFIQLTIKTFSQISNYLNSKYTKNQIILNNTNILKINDINFKKKRKKIKLYSVDLFDNNRHRNYIKNMLKDQFIIKFDSEKPDYLIYNIFGWEHLNHKYKNVVKIAFYTENKIPDFNEVDYAIGHYHINYLDRYFKFSIFFWSDLNTIKDKRNEVLNKPIRSKFCAGVISNSISTDGFRLKFIKKLNEYKSIDMGGLYNNNVGGPIKNKIEFLSSYKFSISMENSEGDGYLSEKIIHAFLSGTIPIYYGDYMIDEYINPKSYILIKGEKDINDKIEYIKSLDNDDVKYKNMLKENVIIDELIGNINRIEQKEFLINIFSQEKLKAYRRNN